VDVHDAPVVLVPDALDPPSSFGLGDEQRHGRLGEAFRLHELADPKRALLETGQHVERRRRGAVERDLLAEKADEARGPRRQDRSELFDRGLA
jgi:hypothetical protein